MGLDWVGLGKCNIGKKNLSKMCLKYDLGSGSRSGREAEAFFKILGGSGSGREAKNLRFHITDCTLSKANWRSMLRSKNDNPIF